MSVERCSLLACIQGQGTHRKKVRLHLVVRSAIWRQWISGKINRESIRRETGQQDQKSRVAPQLSPQSRSLWKNSAYLGPRFFTSRNYLASPWCQVSHEKVEDAGSARTRVEVCLGELNKWMLFNNLRLNNDKTDLLVLHAKHRPKPPLHSITVGEATVGPTSNARNIRAIFDDTLRTRHWAMQDYLFSYQER